MRVLCYRKSFHGLVLAPALLSVSFLGDLCVSKRVNSQNAWLWGPIILLCVLLLLGSLRALAESLAHRLILSPSRVAIARGASISSMSLFRGTVCVWRVGRFGQPLVNLGRQRRRVIIHLVRYSRRDRLHILAFMRRQIPDEPHKMWHRFRDELKRPCILRHSV